MRVTSFRRSRRTCPSLICTAGAVLFRSGAGLPEPRGRGTWLDSGRPRGPRGRGSVDGMWVAVGWTSPEGGLAGGIFCRRGRARRCGWGWRWGAGLADQAELSGPGCGLGAVGRAELVQDVAGVLLDGVEGDHQLGGNGRGLQVGVTQIRSYIRQLADMVVEAVGRFACVDINHPTLPPSTRMRGSS